MSWEFTLVNKIPKLNSPILVEGLPGIGNVGKVVVDFLIDELKAVKLYDIFSFYFPHTVFVNEDNLVEFPNIEIYYKKFNNPNKSDILFLSGDVQPFDEVSCYEFCDAVLDIVKKIGVNEIITLGGIGLQNVPSTPKVYCTGTSKKTVDKYAKDAAVHPKLYGVVGPIVGVSGVLLGMAKRKKLEGVALLAETIGHPLYLGIKGARETLKVLDKKLGLSVNLAQLDKEIKGFEKELIKTTKQLSDVSRETARRKMANKFGSEVSYIG